MNIKLPSWLRSSLLSLALLLTLGAGCASAQVAFVQSKQTVLSGAGTTIAVALTSNATAGNCLAIAIGMSGAAPPTISSVAGNSNTYTVAAGPTSSGSGGTNVTLWLYYAKNINSGATTVTVTFGTSVTTGGMSVHEVSGCDTTAPLDQAIIHAQSNATGTDSYTSGNVTTVANGEYIFGSTDNDNGASSTTGTGYTSRITANFPPTEDKIQTSAGAVATTFTPTNAFSTSVTGILTLKAAGGGAPACTDSHMLGVWRCDEVAR